MKRPAAFVFGLAAGLMAQGPASARDAEGQLRDLLVPNEGAPALVRPGATFRVLSKAQGRLSLVNGRVWPVEAAWKRSAGRYEAVGTVAQTVPPGRYALLLETDAETDLNACSVWVYDSFPETYAVAHVTDPRLGVGSGAFSQILDEINAEQPALVLISGNLTQTGAPADFLQLLGELARCDRPTFLTPGDLDRRLYETYFGPANYAVWFGQDAYLALDLADPDTADGLGAGDGELHRLRRAIKAARWATGFTARYVPTAAVRAQLALFVDDPLDFVLTGADDAEQETVLIPWGATTGLATPPASAGHFRLIDVTPQRPFPGPIRRILGP